MTTAGPTQVGAGEGYLPPSDATTQVWWDATREHRLLLQHCTGCDRVQWQPGPVCRGCGRMDALDWRPSAGAGVVDTFTVVHRAPRPDLATPYVVGRVRLDDGVVMLATLDLDPATAAIGAPVALGWRDLADGRALPVFGPASPPAQEERA